MTKKGWIYSILGIIVVWGTVLRVYHSIQASYWMDEAYSITLAQAIVHHGYPLLDSGQTIWRDPVYHYLLAGVIRVGGISEITTRLPSVITGVSGVVLLGYIAYSWFGRSVGLVTLGLMSLSYWEIAWSRQARMYMLFQVLVWLVLLMMQRKVWWPWLLLSSLVTIASHRLGIIVIGLAILFLVSQKHIKNIFVRSSFIVGTVFFTASMSRFYYGHWVNYWLYYWQYLVLHYPVTLFFAGLGVVVLFYKQQHLAWWLASIFITYLGILSYAVPLVQYRYLFVAWPIAVLCAAYGIVWLLRRWKFSIVLIVAVVAYSDEYIFFPKTTIMLESDALNSVLPYKSFTPQPDFKAAYVEIRKSAVTNIITPYPVITRLYLERDDTWALPLDLTGTTFPKTKRELYTGVEYLSAYSLQVLHAGESSGIILMDTFSRRRIDPVVRDYIEDNLQMVYEYSTGPWSTVQLYKF